MSATPLPELPERRLMHDIVPDGRERHYFRKRSDFRPGDLAYYECDCGAQADRFRNLTDSPWET